MITKKNIALRKTCSSKGSLCLSADNSYLCSSECGQQLARLKQQQVLRNSVSHCPKTEQLYFHLFVRPSVRPSVRPHGDISIYLHCMMFQTIQTIYFLKAHHLVMIMTETKSYKKTNTKTKTHRHIQRQKQSASKTQCMLYLSKAGSSRI